MNQNKPKDENSSDYESISTIEDFDILLHNMNQDSYINQVNRSIIDQNIELKSKHIVDYRLKNSFVCNPILLLYRLFDFIMLILLTMIIILLALGIAIYLTVYSISLYSVILMNYVFFISSIISYTMAPIYKSLAGDWINFTLSFAQVILASPLIAFYIFFILKSVLSLAEFFMNTPRTIKDFFSAITMNFKGFYISYYSTVFKKNYRLIFNWKVLLLVLLFLIFGALYFALCSSIGYGLLCFDKMVIIIGALNYIVILLQIIILLFPSYIYFIQTLIGKKCKENEVAGSFIEIMTEFKKKIIPKLILNENESSDSSTDKEDKIIDDPDISKLKHIDTEYKEKISSFFKNSMAQLFADDYFSLYYYSEAIAFDRHKQIRKRFCMLLFLILNLTIISYDIYQLTKDYSDYLLASVIVRFILIPLFSYYNILTVFYHRAKDKSLKIVNYVSLIFTFIIIIVIIACSAFIDIYQSRFRINNLDYVVNNIENITVANENLLIHPICSYKIFDISAFDAFGYALGGFDIKRNKTVFDNQMKIFFGENYSTHISYKIFELDKYFLFLKFYDSNIDTHIFAFRGYNSETEIAFQFELFASYYIIPFFEDNVPFYEFINDNWLSFYTDFLNSFGLRFFENRNLIVKYIKNIKQIYENENFEDEQNVIFTGINCGGVIAKIVGTMVLRKSISFISFPMEMDFLEHLFHFSSSYKSYVTNVFNVDGFFSHPDSDYAVNIGIETPIIYKTKYCTASICDVFSKTDNIYRTLCTMSEICGKGNQFNYYCEQAIGKKTLEMIRENIQDSD